MAKTKARTLNADDHSVPAKSATKKRKRIAHDTDDQPATKQKRTEEVEILDTFLDQDAALKIIDILSLLDHGWLDQPLQIQSASYTLRSLLRDAAQNSLLLIKSAVHQLQPDVLREQDSQQQLDFCNLANSLLDQASFHSSNPPPNLDSIFSETTPQQDDIFQAQAPQRFALVQHLPQGDYWTSLTSRNHDPTALNDLSTGHSELVAVIPRPSTSQEVPRLSTLNRAVPEKKQKIPEPRVFHRGSFLDYGMWASFAPVFDQEAADVGQRQLSEYYYHRESKRRRKEYHPLQPDEDIEMLDGTPDEPQFALDPELADVLPPEDIASIKDALSSLELETAVFELLEKNQRALEHLQVLQYQRLGSTEYGTSTPQPDSEEWQTANAILESLTLLASLRPRGEDAQSLVPPPSVLHTLHRTLPLSDMQGWQGTLPPGRVAAALRDNSTVKVRSSSMQPPTVPSTPSVQNVPPSLATPYPGYYNTAAAQYRPGGAVGKTPSQPALTAASFYAAMAQLPQAAQASYFNAATYPTVGQQPYSTFQGWYGYTPTSTTASGRGTPQPSLGTAFGGYFNNNMVAAAAQQKPPAVANTVAGKFNVGFYPTVPALPTRNNLVNGQQQ